MNVLGIIPARYASSRFPGKPLADIKGKPMIQRVYEAVLKSEQIQDLVVATDDERIVSAVKDFGGNVMLTDGNHQSGTDRCGEVIKNYGYDFDVVVNIQGDEPTIKSCQLQELLAPFEKDNIQITTLAHRITEQNQIDSPNLVKVVADINGKALYFSRSVIPSNTKKIDAPYFQHIGLYAFKTNILKELINLPPSSLEKCESLEQLRWMQNGYEIYVSNTQHKNIGVDTPEDLNKLIATYFK